MKVYRFRSLGDCQSLERVKQILTKREFWCSRFWELNDPMEGIYRLNPTSTEANIKSLFDGKANSLICSFSGEKAVQNPLMWGYYANGFKGIAIELEVDQDDVKEVVYRPCLFSPEVGANAAESIRNLLCRKLEPWGHECEWRVIRDGTEHSQQIGSIRGIVIGYPYPNARDHPDSDSRWKNVREYDCRVTQVIEIAKDQGFAVKRAQMKNGSVCIEDEHEGTTIGPPPDPPSSGGAELKE